jgi:hypothetical protein
MRKSEKLPPPSNSNNFRLLLLGIPYSYFNVPVINVSLGLMIDKQSLELCSVLAQLIVTTDNVKLGAGLGWICLSADVPLNESYILPYSHNHTANSHVFVPEICKNAIMWRINLRNNALQVDCKYKKVD